MFNVQPNHFTYSFKTMKLQGNSICLQNNPIKALRGRNVGFLTYLRLKKLNHIEQDEDIPISKRKNTQPPSNKINKFSPRRKLTQANIDKQSRDQKTYFITQNPQQFTLNNSYQINRPKTSCSQQSYPLKTVVTNYFPQRKTKKSKDSKWYNYLNSEKVKEISLRIQMSEEKKLYIRNRLEQRRKYYIKRCATADVNIRKKVKKESIDTLRRTNQDISPWMTPLNESEKSIRKLE